MSEKYSKADLRHIAEDMIEDLRECEDGTVTTTGRLARDYGYDDMETFDLFDLHDALFRAAKANKITLDMSEHDGKVEGLPFNLTFVVKNKKAQIKCPRCGSTDTARYIYGYPAFSEKMQKKLDEGKWVLGGCCISSVDVNGVPVQTMPARHCNKCKKDLLRHRYSLRRRRIWLRIIEILLPPSSSQLADSLKVILRLQFQKMMREQLLR